MYILVTVIILKFFILASECQIQSTPNCETEITVYNKRRNQDYYYYENNKNAKGLRTLHCQNGTVISEGFFETWRSDSDYKTDKIVFTNSLIHTIPVLSFHELSDLKEVNLNGAGIKILEAGCFGGLKHLEILQLNGNNIEVLDKGVLSNLFSLNTLNLANNQLQTIHNNSFKDLIRLEWLLLDGNNLHLLPEGLFSSLKNIQTINLSGNNLEKLSSSLFYQNYPYLTSLSISNNRLVTIQKGAFDGLPNLKHLHLNGNRLQILSDELFSRMSSIQIIDLSNNYFKTFNSTTFNNLVNLQLLNINNNRLEYFPSRLFKDLSELTALEMSNNSLTNITSGLLFGLEKLVTLNISHNKLTTLTSNDLYFLSNLMELDVSYNNIGLLNAKEFITFLPNLKNIYINGNNWTCSILSSIFKDFKISGIITKYGSYHNSSNVFGIPCIKFELPSKTNGESEISQYSEYFSNILMELIEKVSKNNNLMEQQMNVNLNSSRNIQFLTDNAQKIVANAVSDVVIKNMSKSIEATNNHLTTTIPRVNSKPLQQEEVNQQPPAIINKQTSHAAPISENNSTQLLKLMDDVKEQSQMITSILNAIKNISQTMASTQAKDHETDILRRPDNQITSERLHTNPSTSDTRNGNSPTIICLSVVVVILLVVLGFIYLRNKKNNFIVHNLRRLRDSSRSHRNRSEAELTASSNVMLNSEISEAV